MLIYCLLHTKITIDILLSTYRCVFSFPRQPILLFSQQIAALKSTKVSLKSIFLRIKINSERNEFMAEHSSYTRWLLSSAESDIQQGNTRTS